MISPDPKIPTDWRDVLLGNKDFAATKSGSTPSRKNADSFNGRIPWLKSGELDDNDIWHTEESVSEKAVQVSSLRILPANTVLIAMYGATAGKTGLLRIRATINQAICSIQPVADSFSSRFLQYFLMNERPALLRRRYGGAQPNLNQGIIKQIQVLLPPLPEQKKIAAVLLKVQRAIETQEKIIQSLRDLKKSTMQHLFTYGLRSEKTKLTEIGEIPESWQMAQISEVSRAQPQNGIFIKDPVWVGGLRYLNVADVYKRLVVDAERLQTVRCPYNAAKSFLLETGDILFVRSSPKKKGIGMCCVYMADKTNALFDCHLIRVRLKQSRLNPIYLASYWASATGQNELIRRSKTTTMTTINQKSLAEALIPIPLKEEQEEIADVHQSMQAGIDIHESKKSDLQDLFKTTLERLMTGEIRTVDLDIDVSEVET